MKFVIQRVTRGCVRVEGQVVGQIGKGLMVLVGLTDCDCEEYIDHVVEKILNIRLFDDEKGARWKESVQSLGLEVLLVSQFTLYHILKGNKPDFHSAMDGNKAKELFGKIVAKAREKYDPKKIQEGKFGEHMYIDMECDGPVTINWEYPSQNAIENNSIKKPKGGKNNENKKNEKKEEGKNKEKKENKKKDKNAKIKKDDDKIEDDKKEDKKEEDKKEDKKNDDKIEDDKKEDEKEDKKEDKKE